MASSLNSSYCYILHSGSSIFTWSGNLTTAEDQELVERQLDIIKVLIVVMDVFLLFWYFVKSIEFFFPISIELLTLFH